MTTADFGGLRAVDPHTGHLNVLIETPKGHRSKFKYDPARHLYELGKLLPLGMEFPFDFGFLPATQGQDGDPLDVLVLMDEPTFTGCLVRARLIGVIEAEQSEKGEPTVRNDRLVAVAEQSYAHSAAQSLKDLDETFVGQIEQFFVAYNALEKRKFTPTGRFGPDRARKLIDEGVRRFDAARG